MINQSYTFLREAEEDAKIEINYDALIDLQKKDFSNPEIGEEGPKDDIVFYCKDCKALVDVNRIPPSKQKKVQFCCATCQGKSVFYGTKRGVEKFFHLK